MLYVSLLCYLSYQLSINLNPFALTMFYFGSCVCLTLQFISSYPFIWAIIRGNLLRRHSHEYGSYFSFHFNFQLWIPALVLSTLLVWSLWASTGIMIYQLYSFVSYSLSCTLLVYLLFLFSPFLECSVGWIYVISSFL